jgi:hypothetical protein
MTLPKGQYQDPAIGYELKQEKEAKQKEKNGNQGCNGCASKAKVWGVEYCIQDLSKSGKDNMVRCKYFKEVSNV